MFSDLLFRYHIVHALRDPVPDWNQLTRCERKEEGRKVTGRPHVAAVCNRLYWEEGDKRSATVRTNYWISSPELPPDSIVCMGFSLSETHDRYKMIDY